MKKFILAVLMINSIFLAAKEKTFDIFQELKKAQYLEADSDKALESIDGKIFGLYFTAKWCSPCRTFTPKLVKFRNEHKDNFQFIMMSWDKTEKSQKEYLKKTKMEVSSVRFDDPFIQKVNNTLRVSGIPTLILFNSKGEILHNDGRELMNILQKPSQLDFLQKLADGPELLKMIMPFQEALQEQRNKEIEIIRNTCKEYKEFPYFEDMLQLHGYAHTKNEYKKILYKVGKEIVQNWEEKKFLLDELRDLAVKFKPQTKGYRGILEVSAGSVYEVLGNHTSRAAIKSYILNKAQSGTVSEKSWAVSGLVSSAVNGDREMAEILINYKKHLKGSHIPLKIFPNLYKYCKLQNNTAIEIAVDIYKSNQYYAYSAFPAFYYPALAGNKKALDALVLFTEDKKSKGYDQHALDVIKKAAEKHEYAKELLKQINQKENI